MAIACTGVTVTWESTTVSGVAFEEVSEVRVSYGSSLPEARSVAWAFDVGTIELRTLHTANLSVTNYGTKGTLTFAGGGLDDLVAVPCIFERVTSEGRVNDVTRYGVTFRIVG
jgi:hypothetical protein